MAGRRRRVLGLALLALLGFTLALAAPEAPVQGDQPPAAGLPGEEATEQAQEEVGNEGVSSEAEVVEADESPPQQQQQQQPQEEAKEAKEAAVEDIREHLVSHLKEAIENGKVRVFVQSQVVQKEQGLDVDTFAAGGSLDSFERDNHFIVGVSSASRPLSSSGAKPPSSEKHRKVRVTNYEGVELECVVPVVPQQSQEESSEAAMADAKSSEDAWDDSEFEERASKLLGTDTLKNCHRKVDGWWTYEVCPLAHVRQYHAENNQILSSFNLGTFNATKTIERFRKRKGQRTVSFVFDEGTKCDLTSMPRTTIVNFSCSSASKDSLKTVTETSSCAYVVDFESKELCKHEEFQKEAASVHHIDCKPV